MVSFKFANIVLTLPNPVFDNSEKIYSDRIYRESRGGDKIVYRDPMWPVYSLLTLQWIRLTEQQKFNIGWFIIQSLGQYVTYTDHEGRQWQGIINNPGGNFSQPRRGTCGYNCSIDMEATLVTP